MPLYMYGIRTLTEYGRANHEQWLSSDDATGSLPPTWVAPQDLFAGRTFAQTFILPGPCTFNLLKVARFSVDPHARTSAQTFNLVDSVVLAAVIPPCHSVEP